MAHTNPWSNLRPLGSQQASTADDEVRTLRVDIFERQNDICEDWAADPVKLKPSAVREALGVTAGSAYKVNTYSIYSGAPVAGTNVVALGQLLPNDIVDQIQFFASSPSAGVAVKFSFSQLSTGVVVDIASDVLPGGVGIKTVLLDRAPGDTIGSGLGYFVQLSAAGGTTGNIVGVSVLFRRPV